MIRAAKYLDLETCVLRVAAAVLEELRLSRAVPLPELEAQVRSRVAEGARFRFVPALSLLFLLGRLEYDEEADAVLLARNDGEPLP